MILYTVVNMTFDPFSFTWGPCSFQFYIFISKRDPMKHKYLAGIQFGSIQTKPTWYSANSLIKVPTIGTKSYYVYVLDLVAWWIMAEVEANMEKLLCTELHDEPDISNCCRDALQPIQCLFTIWSSTLEGFSSFECFLYFHFCLYIEL